MKARNKALSARTYSILFVIFVFSPNIIDIEYATVTFPYVQTSDNNSRSFFVKYQQN